MLEYSATVKMPPVTLKVSGSAKCVARNHVGNNWSKGFTVNGEEFRSTGKVPVELGDTITVGCWIEEDDKNPDWDGFTEKILITPEIMTKGTKLERTVYVTEKWRQIFWKFCRMGSCDHDKTIRRIWNRINWR